MYSTSHPTSMRNFRLRPPPSTDSMRDETPAAFSGVHFTSNWSTPRPPASRTSCRIRALSCQATSERHLMESDLARPMSVLLIPSPPRRLACRMKYSGTSPVYSQYYHRPGSGKPRSKGTFLNFFSTHGSTSFLLATGHREVS